MRRLAVFACLAACGGDTPDSDANPPYSVAVVTEDSKFLLASLDEEHVLSTVEALSGLKAVAYQFEDGDTHCGLSPDGRHVALLGTMDGAPEDVLRLDIGDIRGTSVDITSTRTVSPFFGVKWSPDSRRVAYLSRAQADAPYLLHVDDDVLTTTDSVAFVWRDDAQAIAYVATQPVTGVYVTRLSGNPQQLASNFAAAALLRFAPGKKTLAFIANEIGNSAYSLWIADTASAGVATNVQNNVDDFAWSPDGTRLAYGTGTRLELVTPGAAPVVLAQHAEKVSAVQWSSDGRWLAYLVGDDAAFGFWSLYVVRADGASPPQLASGSTNAALASLAFSPTAPVLAYTPYNDADRALYFVDLASGAPSLIPVSPVGQKPAQFGQAWSPDGTKLVYALEGNGFPQAPPTAFMVDVTTQSPPAPLAIADGYDAVSFIWSPDSKNLLAHYREELPDGATIFQFGRVVTGGLQPLDEVSRTAHCARWR